MSSLADRRQVHLATTGNRWPTPLQLRGFLWSILAGALLLFLVGEGTLQSARQALKVVGQDAAPSILAAQEIKAQLADLDAQAATYLLTSDEQADVALELFELRRGRVLRRLVDASQNITFGDQERGPILTLHENLARYLELMGEARSRHERGERQAALESYRAATDLLHSRLLPAADELDRVNSSFLDRTYDERQRGSGVAEAGAVLIGAALVAGLLWCQLFLFLRTRRILNLPLLGATILTISFLGYLTGRFNDAREDLSIARQDAFASIHLLWKVRAIANDAAGDEVRALLDRERASRYEPAFDEKVKLLTPTPSVALTATSARARKGQGLFAEALNNITFHGERESLEAMTTSFRAFHELDRQLRAQSRKSDNASQQAAIAMAVGGADQAFDRFDSAVQRALGINRGVFDQVLQEGDQGLRRAELLDPLFALSIALLSFFGLRPRIREYD
jgi:hypothetical protein